MLRTFLSIICGIACLFSLVFLGFIPEIFSKCEDLPIDKVLTGHVDYVDCTKGRTAASIITPGIALIYIATAISFYRRIHGAIAVILLIAGVLLAMTGTVALL